MIRKPLINLLIILSLLSFFNGVLAADDDITDAEFINVNTWINGTWTSENPVDFYQFILNKDGKIDIEVSHSYQTDSWGAMRVMIYDSSNLKIYETELSPTFLGTFNSVEIGLPQGIYYLKMSSSYNTNITYDFRLNYSASNYYEKELNDTLETANLINTNELYYGSWLNNNADDYYKFTIPQDGFVELNCTHGFQKDGWGAITMALYNSANLKLYSTTLSPENLGTFTSVWLGVPKGDYYLQMRSSFNQENTYNFKVNYKASSQYEKELNNSLDTANLINLNEKYFGSWHGNDADDFYKFTLTHAETINLVCSHSYQSDAWGAITLSLIDSTNKTIYEERLDPEDLKEFVSPPLSLEAGTYYIKFRSSFNSEITYNLTVSTNRQSNNSSDSSDQNNNSNNQPEHNNNSSNTSDQNNNSGTGSVKVYRVYNRRTGEHLYTTDKNEVNVLTKGDWNDEGIGWTTSNAGTPVYRLYSPVTGFHLYTTDTNEVNTLSRSGAWSVDNDGKALFYSSGSKSIYRLYNNQLRQHLLTTDEHEYSILSKDSWTPEGVALQCVN